MHIDWPNFVPCSALVGYCPGPAIVAAMVAGMLHDRLLAVALSPASVELATQGDA